LEASPWAERLDPEIGSPSATTTVTTEEPVTDFSTEPVLGDENGAQYCSH
ncbi:LytR family transcriptional regulator, partial [Streptococcus suis]